MEKTETPELIAALCKAQSKFNPAIKDANNPFFKSKYADLNSVWLACKDALAENDLFISQIISSRDGKNTLKTRVYHKSGGYIESEIDIVSKNANDPQSLGSGITYMRRYSLAAILGIIVDDDDAEDAMNRKETKQHPKPDSELEKAKEEYYSILNSDPFIFDQKDIEKFALKPEATLSQVKKGIDFLTKEKKSREDQLNAIAHEN